MTPLPVNPKVVVLLNPEGKVEGVASNIAPTPELEVIVTNSPAEFREASLGKPFVQPAN